ncbi:MAG: YheC/YheD family protein [Solirubrobacterales bacterium]
MTAEEYKISVPESILPELRVTADSTVSISAGTRLVKARVSVNHDKVPLVTLAPNTADSLMLPRGKKLHAASTGQNTIRVGPIIGILTKEYQKERNTFGPQNRFYRKLLAMVERENGVGYVFTPDDVDWSTRTVYGYYVPGENSMLWRRGSFPFPQVCYNRYFRKGVGLWSQDVLTQMMKTGTVCFNEAVGSKWHVHQYLSEDEELKKHLPDTRLLIGSASLDSLLKKHKRVYVKPIGGCQGKGITRIQRSDLGYLLKRTSQKQAVEKRNVQEVLRFLRFDGYKNLLVQQAIDCPVGSEHFDIRVMVQKDHRNKWLTTGMAARIGAQGHVTTNLHAGGHASRVDVLLKRCGFSESERTRIIGEIESLAVRTAEVIEKKITPLGELGLDFILDQYGKVWFLEANSKPGRRSFAEIEAFTERRESILRPIQYARYLAGF